VPKRFSRALASYLERTLVGFIVSAKKREHEAAALVAALVVKRN
jgi:hypothetical protein